MVENYDSGISLMMYSLQTKNDNQINLNLPLLVGKKKRITFKKPSNDHEKYQIS